MNRYLTRLSAFFSLSFIKRLFGSFAEFLDENVIAVKKINGEKKRISVSARFLLPENIYIGENTNINRKSFIWASPNAKIVFGKNCLTGPGVIILSSKFNIKQKGYLKNHPSIEKDVIIGDNVWLGANVIILPGVKIGNNSIVAAGTVLTKSIPEHSIVKGQKSLIIENRKYE